MFAASDRRGWRFAFSLAWGYIGRAAELDRRMHTLVTPSALRRFLRAG